MSEQIDKMNFFITEFAQDRPGDDIKILLNQGEKFSNDDLLSMATQAFMGLYSSGGNNPENKHGVLPTNNRNSLIVYSNVADDTVRMLCIVTEKEKVNTYLKVLNDEKIHDAIVALRVLMSNNEFDAVAANILFKQLNLLLEERMNQEKNKDKDVERINQVFGS